ncbi:hypothetical protein L1987_70382 [Smallanthus sonchifolius]|uniref:Uncharacterized protein n=1 Tax=Smallanthus sonchifolius TaxID=185202 RepID=A0ACB9AQB4_9ASTR|nr:hypothetical protein L1987_70382 [Smallanthus sonchifolius]
MYIIFQLRRGGEINATVTDAEDERVSDCSVVKKAVLPQPRLLHRNIRVFDVRLIPRSRYKPERTDQGGIHDPFNVDEDVLLKSWTIEVEWKRKKNHILVGEEDLVSILVLE